MDISFLIDNSKFNYRVCAVIINDNKILAMKDERLPYYYLQVVESKLAKKLKMQLLEK